MNNINDFIKSLSISDKKTLSQKGLKLVEEVGELARVILPYDSAHGTNHRFIDREAILEEVVDVYLTNISIAHSLGFTDEEFNDVLVKKSEKWSQLQAKEEKAEFPLPFEIHVTVDATEMRDPIMFDTKSFDLEIFKQACSDIKVKPIVINLEINGESDIEDVMTSSKHFGDNRSAYEESERIANELKEYGFKVVRNKIESVPWHPAAPVISNGKEIPNGCYFESHIGVVIKPEEKERLNEFVKYTLTDGHLIELSGTAKLSQNFFKKSKDGSKFVNMLTYRSNICGSPKFKLEVEGIKHLLQEEGFEFEKVEVEYAVYDTNVTHDAKWILGYEVA
jgi:NTP pyrophosphatase (non-canonical NTP hydrolase)